MLVFQPFGGQSPASPAYPHMTFVSRDGDNLWQDHVWISCQEIILRFANYLKQNRTLDEIIRYEYSSFHPKARLGFLKPTIQIVFKGQQIAPTFLQAALEEFWHPIEREAGLALTACTQIAAHAVFLEADPRWAANSLALSIWLQVMRTSMLWRRTVSPWDRYLYTQSYFQKLPQQADLKRVWKILPELLEYSPKQWCGHNAWTAYCGVGSVVYWKDSSNLLAQWMWKNVWSKDE
jgi:hypothetical protein